jgi:hypothetical protein
VDRDRWWGLVGAFWHCSVTAVYRQPQGYTSPAEWRHRDLTDRDSRAAPLGLPAPVCLHVRSSGSGDFSAAHRRLAVAAPTSAR